MDSVNSFSTYSLVQERAPFAFDAEVDDGTIHPPSCGVSTARAGGAKEARLRRTALLGEDIDTNLESMIAVRVDNVPERLPHDRLRKEFERFGSIGDIKILTNSAGRNRGVAFVRYYSRVDANNAVEALTGKIFEGFHSFDDKRGIRCQIAAHSTFFSQNTGALGLTNAPVGEISVKKDQKVEQTVKLSECFSRSGYPWGSKHELKRLEPHTAKDISTLHTVKVENLSSSTTEEQIREHFGVFGEIGDIYIPKPIKISDYMQTIRDANLGTVFVRYRYKRDSQNAIEAMNGQSIEGRVIKVESVLPHYWPTNRTRRYF